MNSRARLNLELASHPRRNKRLFFLCLFLLVVLTAGVSIVSADLYFKFKNKFDDVQLRIEDMERKRGRAQLEETQMTDQIEKESSTKVSKIDLINSLIYRKSFSWIEFLSDLENALPSRCYIVSLAPSVRGDSGIEVRIQVASPSLEELLKLITQLTEMGFENVLIRSEEQAESNLLISEVSFIYEKHI